MTIAFLVDRGNIRAGSVFLGKIFVLNDFRNIRVTARASSYAHSLITPFGTFSRPIELLKFTFLRSSITLFSLIWISVKAGLIFFY